jgi:predicted dehydrogenase
MKEVRIGLIGTGYIGKAHAIAYAQAPTVFNLRGRLVREMVAEVTPELAAARAGVWLQPLHRRLAGAGGRPGH